MTDVNEKPKATDEGAMILREARRRELSEMEFDHTAGEVMKPRNGRELMDMANMMSGAGFMVRDMYRGNPGACSALIMTCARFGLDPFVVSWKTYKASKSDDAPVSYEAQLVTAMINVGAPIKGKLNFKYGGEGSERYCLVTGFDRESGQALEYQSPPISQIHPKNSPLWKSDPDQQLGYYSARGWCRRHYPEIIMGIYARDEISEEPMPRGPDKAKDVTPVSEAAERLKARARAAAGPQVEAMYAPQGADPAPQADDAGEKEIEPQRAESEPDGLLDADVGEDVIEDAEFIEDDDPSAELILTPAAEAAIKAKIEAAREKELAEVNGDNDDEIRPRSKGDLFDEN